jgi:D-xylose 1-dehydrogenase (NADP+, D-xylono-1,5-lactone-forming)
MQKKIINWGILGCAGIAEGRVIPGLLQASGAKLYAISSRGNNDKLKRFQDKFKPEIAYSSYEELLADPKVDAVYIPLPNGLHYEWVLKAAAMKKHILCEKPLGVSKLQVKQMQAACDANGVFLMEAFAYRQSPLTKKVKSLIESGILGKVKFIESCYGYYLDNENDVRFSEVLYGGATYDVGCYNLNLIRYLAGSEPLKINAVGKISDKHGVDEGSSILMEFKDDLEAFAYCSLAISPSCQYTVIGDKGVLKVPTEFNSKGAAKITITTAEKTEEIIIECPDNYMLEIEQFNRVIRGEENPLITFEDSLGNAAVIDESLNQIFGRKR